jgi:hypothetical protein
MAQHVQSVAELLGMGFDPVKATLSWKVTLNIKEGCQRWHAHLQT